MSKRTGDWDSLFDERHLVKRPTLAEGVLRPCPTLKVKIKVISVMFNVPGSNHDHYWTHCWLFGWLLSDWQCLIRLLHKWRGPPEKSAFTARSLGMRSLNAHWQRRKQTLTGLCQYSKKCGTSDGERCEPGNFFCQQVAKVPIKRFFCKKNCFQNLRVHRLGQRVMALTRESWSRWERWRASSHCTPLLNPLLSHHLSSRSKFLTCSQPGLRRSATRGG